MSFTCNHNLLNCSTTFIGYANTQHQSPIWRPSYCVDQNIEFFSLSYKVFTVYRRFNINEKLLERKRKNLGRVAVASEKFYKQEFDLLERNLPPYTSIHLLEILCACPVLTGISKSILKALNSAVILHPHLPKPSCKLL